MKILLLSKKFPYPLREGEPIAITYLSQALAARDCEVSILVMNTTKHYFEPSQLPSDYDHFDHIYTLTVDNRIQVRGALASLWRGDSYILSRFFSQAYADKLMEILQSDHFDIVQLETVYMAHYIPVIRKYSAARISMRAHNVEHEIWDRVAATTRNPVKRWYLLLQNSYLKKFEIERLSDYDIMVAITQRDLDTFRNMGYTGPAVVAPVGLDLQAYPPTGESFEGKMSVCFIGALDWMPNQFGIIWFLEKVWPRVKQSFPDMELHIAGKNTPGWMKRKAGDGVFVHGEIPDAKAFINKHPVLIAPLFSGSGIKVKVLEGLALGRVVVTTQVGAEGIPGVAGKHFLIANDAVSFAEEIESVFRNRNAMKKMGINARAFIGESFDNLEIASVVKAAYLQILKEP